MNNLIKNELTKIFKKKSIYIAIAIIFILIIAINCISKFQDKLNGSNTFNIENMKISLEQYDPNKASDTNIYIQIKTMIDTEELIQKYGENSWQATIISENMGELLNEMNTYKYGIGKNEELYKEKQKEYEQYIQKLDKNDWKYFASTKLEEVNLEIENSIKEKENTEDKVQIKLIKEKIDNLETEKQILNWRIEKNISYAKSDENQMLLRYEMYKEKVKNYENNPTDNHEEKVAYEANLKNSSIIEYSIQNNITANKQNDSRGMLLSFFDQYSIFIVAIIVMIAGTIISEEFNKGTIKLLLVRPYKRWKILLAKFLTCIISMGIIIIVLFVMQLIVGGILFGFESLKIPAVIYNFGTNQIQTMNIFAYIGIIAITKLPMFILIITIAFFLGSIFTNSALAITVALLGYMSSPMINMIIQQLNLGFMKYFITPNWDLTHYLFGGLAEIPNLNLGFSITMNIVYLAIMLIPTFIVFKKKNIKNI